MSVVLSLAFGMTLLVACGSEPFPAAGRPEFAQPTFVSFAVTPAPISPTATPWPNLADDDVRVLPEGLDPEYYSRATPDEVVALWTQLLTGTVSNATSGQFYFRNRRQFEGDLHLCPGGAGYLAGDPEGTLKWKVNPSAGQWYEVTLSHEIPFTGDSVTYSIGIHNGKPVRSGSTTSIEYRASDWCTLAEASIQYAFTAEDRKLADRADITTIEIEEIPWIDGSREFPTQITVEGSIGLDRNVGANYWSAYLSGGVLDAVAYNYTAYAVTQAFSGALHLCGERVAVLDGEPSGIGEWAIQSTGSNPYDAKIVFTLPGDPTFRTIVLGVDGDAPIRMGQNAETGLIGPSPLLLSESSECEN
ncbi:MAG: hypothetical protein HQ477_10060 [Chloroflexi bacterium]|nr:hypothetical protein [Chloroflexota bacterium]